MTRLVPFALPDAVKARIDKVQSPWFRGWERVGAELTDLSVDYREQIDVWTELPPRPRDVEPAYLRLDGPNQWLDETTLPGFRRLVERFQREMGAVADRLMAAMCVGLGLARSFEGALAIMLLAGAFRSLLFAPGLSLLASWFPPERRATAMSLYMVGGFTGTILLSLIGPVLATRFGWRAAFIGFALVGVAAALA